MTTATNTIIDKVIAKVDAAFKSPDIAAAEQLISQLQPQARTYVDETIKAYYIDIDARYKVAVDALNTITLLPLAKKKLVLDYKLPQLFAKNQIANIFDNFDNVITDFSRKTLLVYAQHLNDAQDHVLIELQNRINEIRNKINEIFNDYVRIDEEHLRAVNEALKV